MFTKATVSIPHDKLHCFACYAHVILFAKYCHTRPKQRCGTRHWLSFSAFVHVHLCFYLCFDSQRGLQIGSLCESIDLDDDETLKALWSLLLPDAGPWAATPDPDRSARLCNAIVVSWLQTRPRTGSPHRARLWPPLQEISHGQVSAPAAAAVSPSFGASTEVGKTEPVQPLTTTRATLTAASLETDSADAAAARPFALARVTDRVGTGASQPLATTPAPTPSLGDVRATDAAQNLAMTALQLISGHYLAAGAAALQEDVRGRCSSRRLPGGSFRKVESSRKLHHDLSAALDRCGFTSLPECLREVRGSLQQRLSLARLSHALRESEERGGAQEMGNLGSWAANGHAPHMHEGAAPVLTREAHRAQEDQLGRFAEAMDSVAPCGRPVQGSRASDGPDTSACSRRVEGRSASDGPGTSACSRPVEGRSASDGLVASGCNADTAQREDDRRGCMHAMAPSSARCKSACGA